jgi:hypothetical protein
MLACRRVFISYAHRDGAQLAERLANDLKALACDVWLDIERLKGGDRWTMSIERALEGSDVVLALLSDGSFISETCRAEQGWAIDADKRVIPIRVQRNCKVQLRLYNLQWIDFSDDAKYRDSFLALQQCLSSPNQAPTRPAPQHQYNNAPALPNNFVERPELLARLRGALFLESPHRNIGAHCAKRYGRHRQDRARPSPLP